MVEDTDLFDVYWAPEFTEDVRTVVRYIAEALGSPTAAEKMLIGIEDMLDSKRAMPTSAPSYVGSTGTKRFIASYGKFDIHYVIDGHAIKAIGLKHQLQGPDRTTLPNNCR